MYSGRVLNTSLQLNHSHHVLIMVQITVYLLKLENTEIGCAGDNASRIFLQLNRTQRLVALFERSVDACETLVDGCQVEMHVRHRHYTCRIKPNT